MKIEGPKGPQTSGPTKRAQGTTSSSGASSFRGLVQGGGSGSGESEAAAPLSASSTIASIDTLLAVQALEDPAERSARQRMKKRSQDLLRVLDHLRIAMLTGQLTVGHMVDIADVVASHRERISDPQLTGLLDEIDLRAQVEIAKMRLSLDDLLPVSGEV